MYEWMKTRYFLCLHLNSSLSLFLFIFFALLYPQNDLHVIQRIGISFFFSYVIAISFFFFCLIKPFSLWNRCIEVCIDVTTVWNHQTIWILITKMVYCNFCWLKGLLLVITEEAKKKNVWKEYNIFTCMPFCFCLFLL